MERQGTNRMGRAALAAIPLVVLLVVTIAVIGTAPRRLSQPQSLQEAGLDTSARTSYTRQQFDEMECTEMGYPVLKGFDVVAYFSLPRGSRGVLGKPEYKASFKGFTFYFSSKENADAFVASPARYLPKYGGFCAWGIARETTLGWSPTRMGPDSDPLDAWAVIQGELILVHDPEVLRTFERDASYNVRAANNQWHTFFPEDGDLGPFNTRCFCGMEMWRSSGTYNCGHNLTVTAIALEDQSPV